MSHVVVEHRGRYSPACSLTGHSSNEPYSPCSALPCRAYAIVGGNKPTPTPHVEDPVLVLHIRAASRLTRSSPDLRGVPVRRQPRPRAPLIACQRRYRRRRTPARLLLLKVMACRRTSFQTRDRSWEQLRPPPPPSYLRGHNQLPPLFRQRRGAVAVGAQT